MRGALLAGVAGALALVAALGVSPQQPVSKVRTPPAPVIYELSLETPSPPTAYIAMWSAASEQPTRGDDGQVSSAELPPCADHSARVDDLLQRGQAFASQIVDVRLTITATEDVSVVLRGARIRRDGSFTPERPLLLQPSGLGTENETSNLGFVDSVSNAREAALEVICSDREAPLTYDDLTAAERHAEIEAGQVVSNVEESLSDLFLSMEYTAEVDSSLTLLAGESATTSFQLASLGSRPGIFARDRLDDLTLELAVSEVGLSKASRTDRTWVSPTFHVLRYLYDEDAG